MNKTEFLQGLKAELEGRVPHSVIQENLRYYDTYISEETAKGHSEAEVIESLGGPKIIGRTIVDAAMDAEDRPDGYETYGSGPLYEEGESSGSRSDTTDPFGQRGFRHVHYVDFSKWYTRLIAGLAVLFVIVLLITIFLGILGLAGIILSYLGPVILIFLIIWIFRGSRR